MDGNELFNCSETQAYAKIRNFWEKYGDRFPTYYQKYFTSNIFEMIENNDPSRIDEISKTIFNYLDLLNFDVDKESQFLSFFEQYFGAESLYNKHIITATSNYVPTLSKKISDELEINDGNGSLIIYGPNIVVDNNKMDIKRELFSSRNINSGDDIIVSFSSRENSERVLSAALSSQKELILNCDDFLKKSDSLFNDNKVDYLNKMYNYAILHKDSNFDADLVSYSMDDDYSLVLKRK